jgi:nicotinamidase-related amidase
MPDPTPSKYFERVTAENSVLIMIDHQSGIMQGVRDIDLHTLRANSIALANAAKIHDLPIILTTSAADGPNGPLLPEIERLVEPESIIHRPGQVNSWDDPEFRAAVEATGRRKLIMAGVTTDVCLAFPAISATGDGYDVYAIVDASGTWSSLVAQASITRMAQAGVITTGTTAIIAELLADWRSEAGQALAGVDSGNIPFYGHLSTSFVAASSHTNSVVQQPEAATA